MSWKKNKISTASLEKVTVQVCNNCSELSSASQEPTWPSFGQTLKMFIKIKPKKNKKMKKTITKKNRERKCWRFLNFNKGTRH